MKKFNLELAKQGHPLITRDGQKVLSFKCLDDIPTYPCSYTTDVGSYTCSIHGKYNLNATDDHDLFLDDSIPWEPELKPGDKILIKPSHSSSYMEKIFIAHGTEINGKKTVICVNTSDNNNYLKGMYYRTTLWTDWKTIPKEPSIEINVKINGKECKLSDISEETLLKLRSLE